MPGQNDMEGDPKMMYMLRHSPLLIQTSIEYRSQQ
jgi:hypothetical protein